MNRKGIEDCHRQGKADPNHTIVRFANRKFCYETLDKKFNLRKVDSAKLGKKWPPLINAWHGNVGNSKEQAKFTVAGVPKGLCSWGAPWMKVLFQLCMILI